MEQDATTSVITAHDIGKQYGAFWALRDCTFTVPTGSISALVGRNGAGKTSLIKILASLSASSEGEVTVLGQAPSQSGVYVSEIGYLGQDIPLYDYMTVKDHLRLGAHLNRRWDNAFFQARLRSLDIPLNRRVSKLSGGQRAQVGLAMVLAKQPRLLILDEPVAALDPLAREEFLTSLTDAVQAVEGKLTVLMSSHLLGDLERICDHLIVLAAGKARICEYMDDVLEHHRVLVGPIDALLSSQDEIVIETRTPRQITVMIRMTAPHAFDAHWQVHNPTAEEIVLAYMKQGRKTSPHTERNIS